MRCCFSRRPIALVVLGILGLAVPALADEPVPFRGRAIETVTDVTPVGPNLLRITVTTNGLATHLGRFTGTETLFFNVADGTIVGTRVFIAANGDRLYADIDAAFTSATTVVGTFTFTDGTGRFRDASGEADFEVVTPDGIHLAMTCAGSIEF
jgi:hypothetical protein